MKPHDFVAWLKDCKAAGICQDEIACGEAIGCAPSTVTRYKTVGTTRKIALACQAVLNQIPPFCDPEMPYKDGGLDPIGFQRWQVSLAKKNHNPRNRIVKRIKNGEVSKMLGVTTNLVTTYRTEGCNKTVALACAALLAGLKPYGTRYQESDPE